MLLLGDASISERLEEKVGSHKLKVSLKIITVSSLNGSKALRFLYVSAAP